jgi:3-oxoacyl-[acyl-carrier-protein] synthase III
MTGELRTRIIGVGSYIAEGVLTNFDLEKRIDTTNDWIVERTGIRERRVAPKNVVTSDMAAGALRNALDMAGLKANDLDMIICGTVTGDQPLPATAAYVQQKVGASNHCAAFDLSAACAGFLYGLSIADGFIRLNKAKNIGVIGVELLSRVLDYKDRNTCVLFGDGAGAVVVKGDQNGHGMLSSHIFTDGSLADNLVIPGGGSANPASEQTVADRLHYVKMDGRAVFRWAVRYLSDSAKLALKTNGIGPDDVDVVVAHQANIRILEAVSKRVGIPLDRFVLNIDRMGNTSSASIPLALDEGIQKGRIKENDIILMIALGGGISWGSALIKW